MLIIISCSTSQDKKINRLFDSKIENEYFISSDNTRLHINSWKANNAENIIVAVHGFSDYATSFKELGKYLKEKNVDLLAFDLRGFGRNENFGYWFHYNEHLKDIIEFCKIIKKQNPKKKIFLMGESMGGSLAAKIIVKDKFKFDGLILVAPSIWDFSKQNFLKSKLVSFLSKIFPNLKVSGKQIIKIKPSNNIEMLKEFSKDPFVIHQPNLKSLRGVIELMDDSYLDFKKIINLPTVPTLLIIPVLDEVIPRKPLIIIIKNIDDNAELKNKKITIQVYDKNYHMILRDNNNSTVIQNIHQWLNDSDEIYYDISNKNSYELLIKSKKIHILD